MWRQFANLVGLGVSGLYVSMFDEFNEGNQIVKTAATQADVPVGSGLLSLDEDGTACSSDYYLRLTGDGGRMLRGEIPLTRIRPTPTVPGGSTTPRIALRSGANGAYVTSDAAGAQPLRASSSTVGTGQTFELVQLDGGDVALRSVASGRYVCAENAGADALIANRTAVGPWERFGVLTNANGSTSLVARVNGRYVTAEDAGAGPLIADRTAIGGWEQFTLTVR